MLKDMLAKMASKLGGGEGEDYPPKGPVTPYSGGKEKTPTGESNAFEGDFEEYLKIAKEKGLDISKVKSAEDLQSQVYDKLLESKEGKDVLRGMWSKYGGTKKGGGGVMTGEISDEDLFKLKGGFVDKNIGARTKQLLSSVKPEENPKGDTQKEEPKPERRKITELVETVKTADGTHGIGFVYKNKEVEMNPKTGYNEIVPGSDYTDIVMFPEESEYMGRERKQKGVDDISAAAEIYKKKYNAKNIVRGKSTGEGYDAEYAEQMRKQGIIPKK